MQRTKLWSDPIFFRKKNPVDFVILVVCTANITRSPYVAALLRKTLIESGLRFKKRVVIESAGVDAVSNQPAFHTMLSISSTMGMNLHDHRSRLITPEMVRNAGLVLTMEQDHKDKILKAVPDAYDKVFLITEYGRQKSDPQIGDVIDPTGEDYPEFREFVNVAKKEVNRVLEYMVRTGVLE